MTDRLRRSRITFIGTRGDVDALEVLVDEISPEQRLAGLQELSCLAACVRFTAAQSVVR